MALMRNLLALGLAASVASPAAALVTFGSSSILTSPNFRYVNGGTGNGELYTTNGNVNVAGSPLIVFSVTNAVSNSLPLSATVSSLTLNAVIPTVAGLSAGSPFSIGGISGTFSILALSPVSVGGITSSSLLSATFTNATLAGTIGSSSIVFSGNNTTGTVLFSSDFLNFDNVQEQAFSFTGNTINPLATAGENAHLASFRSSVAGTFATDPVPTISVVPEPASWAMLIAGFGLVGAAARRRRQAGVRGSVAA
jgi:hypothetical protein